MGLGCQLVFPPKSSSNLGPKPYAEEQQTLQAAVRLLARTLGSRTRTQRAAGWRLSWVSGICLFQRPAKRRPCRFSRLILPRDCSQPRLKPMFLLRAPQGFSHPVWLPQQNVSTTPDKHVAGFSRRFWPWRRSVGDSSKVRRCGVARIKTEGVLVTCLQSPDY